MKLFKLEKNWKTNRKLRLLFIFYKDFYNQRLCIDRIDFNSIKFLGQPEDVHIVACYENYTYCGYNFLVEHESFSEISEGAEAKLYNTKIINCIRLIKLPKNL